MYWEIHVSSESKSMLRGDSGTTLASTVVTSYFNPCRKTILDDLLKAFWFLIIRWKDGFISVAFGDFMSKRSLISSISFLGVLRFPDFLMGFSNNSGLSFVFCLKIFSKDAYSWEMFTQLSVLSVLSLTKQAVGLLSNFENMVFTNYFFSCFSDFRVSFLIMVTFTD